MSLIEAARQALEALESSRVFVTTREKIKHPEGTEWYDERITALRTAIAEAEKQEPVAWSVQYPDDVERHRVTPSLVSDTKAELEEHFAGSAATKHIVPLYTIPPAAQWVGLTDEEKEQATGWSVEHIEQALKEKNT